MITIYGFVEVLCLIGNIYFIWRILNKKFDLWIAPLLLMIISYFASSFNYVEAITSLSKLSETNQEQYFAITSYLSLNNYLLTLNILVFVAYILVAIIMRGVVKIEERKKV
jgi:hypothetical protein